MKNGSADTLKEELCILPSRDEQGNPIFSVLTKRTYALRPGETLQRTDTKPFLESDVYYDQGDPETSTVMYEVETTPYKILTDLVLVGSAHAPEGREVQQMDVALQVGGHRKVLRVTGDRRCVFRPRLPPLFTDPEPFEKLPLRYERAYGGVDPWSNPDLIFYYPRNHRGTGVAVKNIREAVDGLPLPNLEDPADMLTPERVLLEDPDNWNDQPLPQGFGYFQKTWYPRCSFVGSVPGTLDPDTVMREERLGLVPAGQLALARRHKLPSFDVRFNNGASLGLAVPFLRGDEPVALQGLSRIGFVEFSLPGDVPMMWLDIGSGETRLEPVLQTVCMRMEDGEVDLIWRGALEYPGVDWLPNLTRLEARVS
jgi:hypothetical protein